jgi:hypothetical protein
VRAVKDWLALLQQHGRTSGPLFLSFHKGQRLSRRRLSTFSLNEIVQLRLGAALHGALATGFLCDYRQA